MQHPDFVLFKCDVHALDQQRIDLQPNLIPHLAGNIRYIQNGLHHADVPQHSGLLSIHSPVKRLFLQECLYIAKAAPEAVPESEQIIALFRSKAMIVAHAADRNFCGPFCPPSCAIAHRMSLGNLPGSVPPDCGTSPVW